MTRSRRLATRRLPLPKAAIIAAVFAKNLRRDLTDGEWQTMCQRNRAETRLGVCHSHDFCDANMVMQSALEDLGLGHRMKGDWVTDDPALTELWNAGWAAARPLLNGEIEVTR